MIRRTTTLLICLLLTACGQKGALFLPDQAHPVVVPPPAATPAPAPAAAAAATPTDDEQRQRQQQQVAPANNATGN